MFRKIEENDPQSSPLKGVAAKKGNSSMDNSSDSEFTLGKVIKEAVFTFVIAFIVFGPIMGMILKGHLVEFAFLRPLFLSFLCAAGRVGVFFYTSRKKTNHSSSDDDSTFFEKLVEKNNKLLLFISMAVAIALPFIADAFWKEVLTLSLIYVLLGLGLNIVVGLAGLLDLGFVAFYAVGAYGLALGYQYWGIGFWMAIPFCAIVAALSGAILGFPVLRMHGDYLAIVTLGFGEIIHLVLTNWTEFTGGTNGVSVPNFNFFGIYFKRVAPEGGVSFHEMMGMEYNSGIESTALYLTLLLVVSFVIYYVVRLKKMPVGRAWEALREDEIACRSLGINHVIVKLSAFSLGAMIGGIGGVFYATKQGFIDPLSFAFIESAIILAIVVLGGQGSVLGVVLSAILLTCLPEVLREFAEYRMVLFGMLMILMMIVKPTGLVKAKRQLFKQNQ